LIQMKKIRQSCRIGKEPSFYFPSADYANMDGINYMDYSLALGENLPVYKNKGKYIIKRISDEFVKIIDFNDFA
ncbi:MAG TPA: hypothetical protein PL169_17710, partial [Leptospiraceae bacterium]|nr:hypothetical protein [Leptospiraceae bacterium]